MSPHTAMRLHVADLEPSALLRCRDAWLDPEVRVADVCARFHLARSEAQELLRRFGPKPLPVRIATRYRRADARLRARRLSRRTSEVP